jgi:hypothetical protein
MDFFFVCLLQLFKLMYTMVKTTCTILWCCQISMTNVCFEYFYLVFNKQMTFLKS